ncbi:MAG: isoleucine--tRNA ligase [Patescibacteria group bacterium]|jgi:isoleucyl-tRNA synthetase|nr:isoleucine--tRNA ligase [Patescibacteria group bacterium]
MKKDDNLESKAPSFPEAEELVLTFWQEAKIFDKSLAKEAPRGEYVFYDGPPFATGTPHYGHIVASVMKDVVPRYQTMKGFRVFRKWGWDCHGLPIENIVEKEMGTKTKKDIEDLGVDKFNELCRSKVMTYADEWEKVIGRLGRFADFENCYRTMDLNFMESVWWVFKQLWDKGLIYKDYRSMHICPRCETTLSQSEVTEGYRDIKDLSAIAKFELLDEANTFILAWTTTPWTLIGNVALAVGDDIDYVKLKVDQEQYIMAKDLLELVMKDKEFEIISEFKGADLVGKKYKPLFNYYSQDESLDNKENAWQVYTADFVTTDEGTGVVHIAPAFGADDMELGKEKKLPFIQHVAFNGIFKDEVTDFKGLHVKPLDDHMATDIEIIKYLAKNNLLFHKEKYEHSYPHCWRCETPLINYATSSWFVGVTKIKDQLLESAKAINWSPEYIKEGRFGNWLEGARDWSISRQRFWASAIPIWECKNGHYHVVSSVKELEELTGEKITDIHKDKVDPLTFACPDCGETMHRISDVIDCWFESGSMPYAQLHYPFENKEKLEQNFPAQFIAEGADQTRAWFYYLHVIAGGIKDSHAFQNVIVNGIVLAEDGKKMSKRLQNYPDPAVVMDKYGADALRAYLLSSPVMQAENLNFMENGVQESLRKNVMTLWNVYRFYQNYAAEYQGGEVAPKHVLDVWIIAKLKQLIQEVDAAMESYNLPKAMRPVTAFIDELSTWYLRRSRDRFKSEDEQDKQAVLATTRFVLINLAKVMAPFLPFIAERLWQSLSLKDFNERNESVHLETWPELGNINKNDQVVLEKMLLVRQAAEMGLAARDKAGIKIRQMLSCANFQGGAELDAEYLELIREELNLQAVKWQGGNTNLQLDLNLEITPELKLEGYKRELVRTINLLRKEAGLSAADTINIYIKAKTDPIAWLGVIAEDLKKATIAADLILDKNPSALAVKELELAENNLEISISRLL